MHLHLTFTSVTTLLLALTNANPILPRAGGPIAKPIPSTCTIKNPF